MKIIITYEKADILRLVEAAIRASGIKVKAGTHIDLKGPLSAKFEVETDDSEGHNLAPPSITPAVAAAATPTSPTVREEEEEIADMSDILTTSRSIVETKPAKFERALREGESYEYPRK